MNKRSFEERQAENGQKRPVRFVCLLLVLCMLCGYFSALPVSGAESGQEEQGQTPEPSTSPETDAPINTVAAARALQPGDTLYLDASADPGWTKGTRFWYNTNHSGIDGNWWGVRMEDLGGGKYSITIPDDFNTNDPQFRFGRCTSDDPANDPDHNPQADRESANFNLNNLDLTNNTFQVSNTSGTVEGAWVASTTDPTPTDPSGNNPLETGVIYLDTSPIAEDGEPESGWETYGDNGGRVIWLYYYTSSGQERRMNLTDYKIEDHKYKIPLPSDMDRTKELWFERRSHDNDYYWNSVAHTTLLPNADTYVLDSWSTGHWVVNVTEVDTLPEVEAGKQRIFYDATLSKLNYPDGAKGTAIPAGGKLVYCTYSGGSSGTIQMTKLTSYTSGTHVYQDVYFADIPTNATHVQFHAGSTPTGDVGTTSLKEIAAGLKNPCFYGGTSDDRIYNESGQNRSGHWGEAFTVQDPGEGTVGVKEETFEPVLNQLYLDTTFYDYYSDFELGGFDRDNLKNVGPQLNGKSEVLVQFRQLNQALSDFYAQYSVQKPLYVGDFEEGSFNDVMSALGLYGRNFTDFYTNNNSGTDKAKAVQQLVESSLLGGLKPYGSSLKFPLFDESFLLGNNSKNTVLAKIYSDVKFPFMKKDYTEKATDGTEVAVDYWQFDSSNRTLALQQDPDRYYLQEFTNLQDWSKNLGGGGYGLFPFNAGADSSHCSTYNYGYGCKIEFTFRLTEDGYVTVKDADGQEHQVPIVFMFSGDDDVWVFVDGNLALDLGGSHASVSGTIDFSGTGTQKKVTVSGIKAGNTPSTFYISGSNTSEHTLTMYYMERGLYDSNMSIRFNFPDDHMLEVEKEVDTADVNDMFKDLFSSERFDFSILNQATHFGQYVAPSGLNSFHIPQINIKDYDTWNYDGLKPANGAEYALVDLASIAAEEAESDEVFFTVQNGIFTLHPGQAATFRNQFRLGSYLYLEEVLTDAQKALYDTSWILYSNNIRYERGDSTVVTGKRTEQYLTGEEDGYQIENAGYTWEHLPYKDGQQVQAIVFRPYYNRDPNTEVPTKLKAVFTNKVKTGSLTIGKEKADGSDDMNGTFTFYVVFSDVGGLDLEGDTGITTEWFTLKVGESKTFTGIPLNTTYTVYEVKPEAEPGKDAITLDHVTIRSGDAAPVAASFTTGNSAYAVTGKVENQTSATVVTFYNTTAKEQKTSFTVTKLWKNGADGSDLTEDLPTEITVQLLRSTDGETWTSVGAPVTLSASNGWQYTFSDLEQKVGATEYRYKAVELNGGTEVPDGARIALNGHDYTVTYGAVNVAEIPNTQTITNTRIPKVTLALTKLDAVERTALGGVEFRLEGANGTVTKTTDGSGAVRFEDLEPGVYRLTEIRTVEGYSLLKAPINIEISENYTATIDGQSGQMQPDGMDYILPLTVYNKKNLEMPVTGGVHGFEFWILGGLCMIAVPLLLYTWDVFKKGGKYPKK